MMLSKKSWEWKDKELELFLIILTNNENAFVEN